MTVARLVVRAVRHILEQEPELLGVRICPIGLTAEDVAELLKEAPKSLGGGLHLVASAPGVQLKTSGRAFVSPDERAAEQATAWRNTVQVSRGEHLLYVSTTEHDKASGLRDCLAPLHEEDLQKEFIDYAIEPASGLPKGLGEALAGGGIVDQVPLAALCSYADAVRESSPEKGAWEAAGQHLPLLGLARDSRLKAADAIERLAANERLVRAAAAGDSRRASAGPTAGLQASLRGAVVAQAKDLHNALSMVDLGELRTVQLRGPKAKTAKTGKVSPPAGGKGGPRAQSPTKGKAEGTRAGESDENSISDDIEAQAEGKEQGEPKGSTEPGRVRAGRGRSPLPLTAGLTKILDELCAHGGLEIEALIEGTPRRALEQLPKSTELSPRPLPPEVTSLPAFESWRAARVEVLNALTAQEPLSTAVVRLIRFPLTMLSEPQFAEAAQRLLDAAVELQSAARRLPSPEVQRAVLALETVEFRDRRGPSLRLLGPLHPLWLGQILALAQAVSDVNLRDEVSRVLVDRALEALASPQHWPEKTFDELELSRAASSLPVYEREPDALLPDALAATARQLLVRLLDLSPHALFGARVVIMGGDPGPLVEGMAECLGEGQPALQALEVFCDRPATLSPRGRAQEYVQGGRLRLGPIPQQGIAGLAPHVVVRLVGPPMRPEDEASGGGGVAPRAGQIGLLRTTFEIRQRGIRTRTSLSGVPALLSFEALHATSRGRSPSGEFLADATAQALDAALPPERGLPATWYVSIGPRLGRRPPPETNLLIYERMTDQMACAVVARGIRPIGRAVAQALRCIDVQEERPASQRSLALHLASASSGGLLSLSRSSEHLVSAGLLALEIQRCAPQGNRPLVARIEGDYHDLLLGVPAEHDPQASALLGIRVKDGRLHITIGYATLNSSAEVGVAKGRLVGGLAESLERLVKILERANADDGLTSQAAREVLSWLLWPAVAAADSEAPPSLAQALADWGERGGATGEALLLVPPGVVASRRTTSRLGRCPATIVPMTRDLFDRLLLIA